MKGSGPAAWVWTPSRASCMALGELAFYIRRTSCFCAQKTVVSLGSADSAIVVREASRLITVGIKPSPCRTGSGENGEISWNGNLSLYVIFTS